MQHLQQNSFVRFKVASCRLIITVVQYMCNAFLNSYFRSVFFRQYRNTCTIISNSGRTENFGFFVCAGRRGGEGQMNEW